MTDSNGGTKVVYFLVGAGLGALAALLLAPQSGRETRDLIAQKAGDSRDFVSAKKNEYRHQAEEYVGKAKEIVNKQKEQLSAALEAGKQAYQEEKSKTTQ